MRTSASILAAMLATAFAVPQAAAQVPPAATPAAPAGSPVDSKPDDNFVIPPGWRARTVKGEALYCKKDTVTGSRMPKMICMTYDQLKAFEANNAENREKMGQALRVCATAATCANN